MQKRRREELLAFTAGVVLAAVVAAPVVRAQGAGGSDMTGGRHEVVSVDSVFGATTTTYVGAVTAPCPAGKKVLGGGMTTLIRSHRSGELAPGRVASGATMLTSHPAAGVDGWTVAVALTLSSTLRGVRVYATCAAVP